MKIDNAQREKIAKAQNISSLISKKLEAESKTVDNSKVNLNNLAEKLATIREKSLQEEG